MSQSAEVCYCSHVYRQVSSRAIGLLSPVFFPSCFPLSLRFPHLGCGFTLCTLSIPYVLAPSALFSVSSMFFFSAESILNIQNTATLQEFEGSVRNPRGDVKKGLMLRIKGKNSARWQISQNTQETCITSGYQKGEQALFPHATNKH